MPVTTRSMVSGNQGSSNNNMFANSQNNQSNSPSYNIFANQQQSNRGNIFASGNNSQNLFNSNGNQNQKNGQNTNNLFGNRNNNGQQGNNLFTNQNNQGSNNISSNNNNQGNSGNNSIFNSQNNQGKNIFNNSNNQNNQGNNNQSNNIFGNNSSNNNNNIFYRNNSSNNNNVLSNNNNNIFSNNNNTSNNNLLNNSNTTSNNNIFSNNNNSNNIFSNNRNQTNNYNWQNNELQNANSEIILQVYKAHDDTSFNRMHSSNVDINKSRDFLLQVTNDSYPKEYCKHLSTYFQEHIKDVEELTQRLLGNRYQPNNQQGYRGNTGNIFNNNNISGGNNLFNNNNKNENKNNLFNNSNNTGNNNIFSNNNTANNNRFKYSNDSNRIFPYLSPLPLQNQPEPTHLTKEQNDLIYDRIHKIHKKNEQLKRKILLIRGHIQKLYPQFFVTNRPRSIQYSTCQKRISQLMTEVKTKINKLKQMKKKQDPDAEIKQMMKYFKEENDKICAKIQTKSQPISEEARERQRQEAEEKKQRIDRTIVELLKDRADDIKNLEIQMKMDRISFECFSEYQSELDSQQALRGRFNPISFL